MSRIILLVFAATLTLLLRECLSKDLQRALSVDLLNYRTTNPLRYSSLQTLNEEHAIGEVWANMLHNVYASLVGVHGFSDTAHTNPT